MSYVEFDFETVASVKDLANRLFEQMEAAKEELNKIRDETAKNWSGEAYNIFFEDSYKVWGLLGQISGAAYRIFRRAEIVQEFDR